MSPPHIHIIKSTLKSESVFFIDFFFLFHLQLPRQPTYKTKDLLGPNLPLAYFSPRSKGRTRV